MKKRYEAPRAEKPDFDYSNVVTASGAGKTKCFIAGTSALWNDVGNRRSTAVAGDE